MQKFLQRGRVIGDPRKLAVNLKQYGIYDYLIVNDVLEDAHALLRAIYLAAQCEIGRMGPVAEALVGEAERPKDGGRSAER